MKLVILTTSCQDLNQSLLVSNQLCHLAIPYQSALDSFLPSTSGKGPGGARSEIDELASKIASKVAEQLGQNFGKVTATTTNPIATMSSGNPNVDLKANNLIDLLNELLEFKLSLEENSWILQCSTCAEFLSSPVAFLSSFRRPSRKATGSLATGLYLSEEVYQQLTAGKCHKWYDQKEAMIKDLSSKTHVNAANHMKLVKEDKSREIVVLKNSFVPQLKLLNPSLLHTSMRNELPSFKQQVRMLATLATHGSFSRRCY